MGGFGAGDENLKSRNVVDGDIGQNFAVQFDSRSL